MSLKTLRIHQIQHEIVLTELPHHLAAHTAGRERAGDHTVLAAADSNGRKVPLSVIDRFEEGGALGAVGGSIGSVFDVAALVHGTVGAEQGSAAPTL